MMPGHWYWGYWGGLGMIFMFIFWVLVIIGIVVLVKWPLAPGRLTEERETALDILKKRYARGEINKKEFEEKKKDLM